MNRESSLVCCNEGCGKPMHLCQCAETDAKLKRLRDDPEGLVAFKWCRTCDKHFARCRCAAPDYYIVCGGRELDPTGVRFLTGDTPAERHPELRKH